MENIKICSIVSSEWHCGHGFAFIQAIFSLKRMRIPLIRAHFSEASLLALCSLSHSPQDYNGSIRHFYS
jgi:hypothetical protein